MRSFFYFGAVVGLLLPLAMAQEPRLLNLMPVPASVRLGEGALRVESSFRVAFTGHREPRLERAAQRFLLRLEQQTGLKFPASQDVSQDATFVLHAVRAGAEVQTVDEDESYRLEVTPSGARLDAPTPLGVLRGLETFLQLVEAAPAGFTVPAVIIEDRPRFPWRGLLLDVCRHFMPLAVVRRNLDAMAALKMNVLHWHLTEDQGFRVESRKFPRLHQMGSDGLFYTQEEVRGLVAYARDRGIRVVPEFDVPGHTTSWFVGHPELASAPVAYSIERGFGVFDPAMDPSREETYAFLDEFLGEMVELFPDAYLHLGGDEVNGVDWDNNARIRQFQLERGLASRRDLQAHFTRRTEAILRRYGKTLVAWDNVLYPGLPSDIVLQSWRGPSSLAASARLGYRALLSSGYYLDYMQPAARHYLVEPLAGESAALSGKQQARILGGEACMWAEYVTPANVDSRIWPRTAAIAERLWSPAQVRDVDDMYRRLEVTSRRLEAVGLSHRSGFEAMLRQLAGTHSVDPLRALAEVVEPVDIETRLKARQYLTSTPLNRLVDTAAPESDIARAFAGLVERIVSRRASAEEKNQAREQLTRWRDNHARLEPLLRDSSLLAEVLPLSQNASAVAAAGLEALDYLESGRRAPRSWNEAKAGLLRRARPPQAELRLMIVAPVRTLVGAVKLD